MSKGKRIREEHAKQPVMMPRGAFKAYLWNVLETADDASYKGLQQIILMACGVLDEDGQLTELYAKSPFWKVENGYLVPSEHTKLIGEISMMGEQKPCKRCGSLPKMYEVENPETNEMMYQLKCEDCGCSTAFFFDEEEAKKMWNAANARSYQWTAQ